MAARPVLTAQGRKCAVCDSGASGELLALSSARCASIRRAASSARAHCWWRDPAPLAYSRSRSRCRDRPSSGSRLGPSSSAIGRHYPLMRSGPRSHGGLPGCLGPKVLTGPDGHCAARRRLGSRGCRRHTGRRARPRPRRGQPRRYALTWRRSSSQVKVPVETQKSGLGAGPGHPEPRRERARNPGPSVKIMPLDS